MTEAAGSGQRTVLWRGDWLRLHPVVLGSGVAALLLMLYMAVRAGLTDAGGPLFAQRDFRLAAYLSLLAGYAFSAAGLARRALERSLSELRPLLPENEEEHLALVARAREGFDLRRSLPWALGGVGVGLVITPYFESAPALLWVWSIPADVVFWAMLGYGVAALVHLTRFFTDLGENLERVDLLAVSALSPFARWGLRISLLWIVGTTLASLSFFEDAIDGPAAVLMGVVPLMAVLALLLPLRGVRRRVQRAKREELARVAVAIRRERDALLATERLGAGDGAALAGLLAWHAHVAAVREWPLDASSLTRFGFYLAIGLGGWVGAAMVERLLDQLLG